MTTTAARGARGPTRRFASTFFEKQQTADFEPGKWGSAAARYERAFSGKFVHFASAALDVLVPTAPCTLSHNHSRPLPSAWRRGTLLDVGCGTGAAFEALMQHDGAKRKFGEYVGVDFSADMVALANKRVRQTAQPTLPVHGTCHVADGQRLDDVPSGSVDAAVGLFSVIFFPDRIQGLRELHRVLRPGKTAVVGGWGPVEQLEWVHLSNQALKQVLFATTDGNSWAVQAQQLKQSARDKPAGEVLPNFLAWSDPDTLRAELEQAGFSPDRVDVRFVHRRFHQPSVAACEQLWHDMARSFPTLRFVFDDLFPHEDAETKRRRHQLQRQVAAAFAGLVVARGGGTANAAGFLDGTAVFGVATK